MNPEKTTSYFWLGIKLLITLAVCVCGNSLSSSKCTLNSSPPPTAFCGQQGRAFDNHGFKEAINSTVPTAADCLNLCFHRAYTGLASQAHDQDCSFFGFDDKSNTCVIWSRGSQFVPDPSSSYTYSDFSCYDCPSTCPSTTDENMLDNGSFEFSNTLYGPWQRIAPGSATIISPGHNSENALTISYAIYQDRNLCNNQTYLLTFDAILNQATAPNVLVGDYNLFLPGRGSGIGGAWKTYGATFQYNRPFDGVDETSVRLSIIGANTKVDNVEIKPVSSSYSTTGDSLLENGGFESGEIAPWYHSNYYNFSGPHGTNAVVQPGLTPGSNFAFRHVQNFKYYKATHHSGASVYLTQNYTAASGIYYQVSFDYHAIVANSITVGAGGNSWRFFRNHGTFPNRVLTFSRTFMGTGETQLFSILIEGGFDGWKTRKFRAFLDNIEIKALANQAIR